jgi:hypothetical protein
MVNRAMSSSNGGTKTKSSESGLGVLSVPVGRLLICGVDFLIGWVDREERIHPRRLNCSCQGLGRLRSLVGKKGLRELGWARSDFGFIGGVLSEYE